MVYLLCKLNLAYIRYRLLTDSLYASCAVFDCVCTLQATGGQDSVLRIWVLESAYNYFDDMRQKYIESM